LIDKLVMTAGTADESARLTQGTAATNLRFFWEPIPAQRAAEEMVILFFHSVTAKTWSR